MYKEKIKNIDLGVTCKVKIELCQNGNQKPYFSITGKVNRIAQGNPIVCRGTCHSEIMEATNKFNDIIPLHLSDINGIPMYAVENGIYFLGLTKYHAFDKAATMLHFRCKEIEIPELLYHAKAGDLQEFLQKKYYPRWKSQAEKCIQKYALMDEKQFSRYISGRKEEEMDEE